MSGIVVTGTGIQTNQEVCDGYNGSCPAHNHDNCDSGYWCYKLSCTFATRPNCTKPCGPFCPPLSDGATGNADWAMGQQVNECLNQCETTKDCPKSGGSFDSVLISCTYESDDFKTAEDVKQYINTFGPGSTFAQYNSATYQGNFNNIMNYFCAQTVTDCQTYPQFGGPAPSCSMMTSTGDGGQLCQQWLDNPDVIKTGITDSIKTNFCAGNPNITDCLCINRSLNPVFDAAKQTSEAADNDYCFWEPCQEPTSYLVLQKMIEAEAKPVCPTTICQGVVDNIDNSNNAQVKTDAKFYISCGTSNNNTNNIWNSITSNIGWIALAIGVLIVIGIVIFIIVKKK